MTNPYPQGWPPPVAISDAQLSQTRRLLRFVSLFYMLISFLTLALAVVVVKAAMDPGPPPRDGGEPPSVMPIAPILALVGLMYAGAVYGHWTSRARILTIAVAGLSLVLFPIGTIFGMGTLWLLFSPAGARLAELSRAKP